MKASSHLAWLCVFLTLAPWSCTAMDVTPEEFAAIARSEEEERRLRTQEEQELQQAMQLSLQEERERQAKEHKRIEQAAKEQAPIAKELNPTLAPLTDEQKLAGAEIRSKNIFDWAPLYKQGLDFNKLHREGNIADNGFLQHIFFGSIFQYYTYDLLGFNMAQNYKNVGPQKLYSDMIQKYLTLITGFTTYTSYRAQDRGIMTPPLWHIEKAIDALKKNKLLQELGIAYMRQKIVTEKLTLNAEVHKDMQKILQHDRYAIDLQTMIYHMMKEAYATYAKTVRSAERQRKSIPDVEFLATFKPHFIQEPYYERIVSKLKELSAPTPL